MDAFADALFGGNPAGVVILDQGTDFPEEAVMRKTAAELRYSETAFIRRMGENAFQFRYFTPAAEVDLCGHATIGSAFVLADAGFIKFGSSCTFHTPAGPLNIDLAGNNVFMDMGEPKDLGKITDQDALRELYEVLGLAGEAGAGTVVAGQPDEVVGAGKKGGEVAADTKKDAGLIPEIISTGLPDILVPVRDEKELAAVRPDFSALSRLSEKYEVVGIHAFTVNRSGGAVHCRNFAPLYGIDEEAATGTSNGALTYYLYKNGLLREGTENLFIQGEAMGRPSKVLSRLTVDGGGRVRIQIGGSAAILARGDIFI